MFSGDSKTPEDYQGPRTAAGITNYILSKLNDKNIKKVNAKNAEQFFADTSIPKALLFTNKPKTAHLSMALSLEFKGRMQFAEIQEKESELGKLSSD